MATKEKTMAVYELKGANIMSERNKIKNFIDQIFKETGRANLIIDNLNELGNRTDDLKKWGNRVYNLTIGELIEQFDLSYKESESIVRKYFESNNLPINHKYHFSNNLYDYPIKEE